MRISERLVSLSLFLVINLVVTTISYAEEEIEMSQGIKEWSESTSGPEVKMNQELTAEMNYLKEGLEEPLESQDPQELEAEIAQLLNESLDNSEGPGAKGEEVAENIVNENNESQELNALLKEEFSENEQKIASLEIPDGDQNELSQIISREDDEQFEDRISNSAAGLVKKQPARSPAIPKAQKQRLRKNLPSDVEELLNSYDQKAKTTKGLKRSR